MTCPPRGGRRSYAHGRKIHHIRFRVDGSVACHLFFIKTKTMKLRQLQEQAMQQAAIKRQQIAATAPAPATATTTTSTTASSQQQEEKREKEEVKGQEEASDSTLLNSHLQQLYKQGRLGDNPYVLHIPQPAPPPPPPAPRRFTRPPQPLTARIPTLRIDPGPSEDEQKEQKERQPASQLHSRVSSSGELVPLFDRECVWYLYPKELSMAAELDKKQNGGRQPEVTTAAEALVRSKPIKAR